MSNVKYHINKKGEALPCRALFKCRFGSSQEHYASAQEARSAYERTAVEELDTLVAHKYDESYPVTPQDFDYNLMGSSLEEVTEDTRREAKRLMPHIALETPRWEHARRYGFLSIPQEEGRELLVRSFEYYEEAYNEAGYTMILTEWLLLEKGRPQAYYSTAMGDDRKPSPPITWNAEVRQAARGRGLGMKLQGTINELMGGRLLASGYYTAAGRKALAGLPVWHEGPQDEGYEIDAGVHVTDRQVSFVRQWDRLETDAWSGDFS